MKIHEAKRFEQHMNNCVRELSSALLVAQKACDTDELLEITRKIGHIIARADTLLHDKIYNHHPELKLSTTGADGIPTIKLGTSSMLTETIVPAGLT